MIRVAAVILAASFSVPSWVPDRHKAAMGRILADNVRLEKILRDAGRVTCKVDGDGLTLTIIRHDLKTPIAINLKGVKSCDVSNGVIDLEVETPSASFGECLGKTGIGFGAGFVAGLATCAALRK